MPPGFDRFESFGHDDLTAKHCYFNDCRGISLKLHNDWCAISLKWCSNYIYCSGQSNSWAFNWPNLLKTIKFI